MRIAAAVFVIVFLSGFWFVAGRLFEQLFGDVGDYLDGWDVGFDEGMKFAKENKDLIDRYKGHGVWAVGECEDDFKEAKR